MVISWIWIVLIVSRGLGQELCQTHSLATFYDEIGCVPNKHGSDCPSSYDCSKYENRDKNACYFQGKSYAIGANVETTSDMCAEWCRCSKDSAGHPGIRCANVECASVFGVRPEPNCRFVYEHSKCCYTGTACGPSKTTCSYRNTTYQLGQRFYPEEEPCKTCICMENFKGVIEEPFCKKVQCNSPLHSLTNINQGCVPVYYGEDGCCPIQWKCPDDMDSVRKAKGPKVDTKTQETCKFGSLILQPGDELQHSDKTFVCGCKLPPFVTCIAKKGS